MTTIFAYWKNGDYSIINAASLYDLFWQLDNEGNPYSPSLRILPTGFSMEIYNDNKKLPHITSYGYPVPVSQLPKLSISMLEKAIENHTEDQDEQTIWFRQKTIKQACKLTNSK
jgi:hypothetical protein